MGMEGINPNQPPPPPPPPLPPQQHAQPRPMRRPPLYIVLQCWQRQIEMWEDHFNRNPPRNNAEHARQRAIVTIRHNYHTVQCQRLNRNPHRINAVFARLQRQLRIIRGYPLLPRLDAGAFRARIQAEPFMAFLGALERNAVQPDLMTALDRVLNDHWRPRDCPDLLLAVMRFGKFHHHPIGDAIREIYRWLREERGRKERCLPESWTASKPVWNIVISPAGIEDADQRMQWYRDVCTWIECERVAQWEDQLASAAAFGAFVQAWSGIPQIDVVEQYHQFGGTVGCVDAGLRYARDAHTAQRLLEQPEMQRLDLDWWASLFHYHLRIENGRLVDNGILQCVVEKAAEQLPQFARQENNAYLFKNIFFSISYALGALLQKVDDHGLRNDVIRFWVQLVHASHLMDHTVILEEDLSRSLNDLSEIYIS